MNEQRSIVKPVEPGAVQRYAQAEIDMQVATAKQYPRDVVRAQQHVTLLATTDAATAAKCYYVLQRRGADGRPNTIYGPSVHLARIVVTSWGNMRAGSRILAVEDRQVIAQGLAWDLESNTAVQSEVTRRITTRAGKRFGDDMIQVTSRAACAIAYRNAIWDVVPRSVYDPAYEACLSLQRGEAGRDIAASIDAALKWFMDTGGIERDEVIAALGVDSPADVTADHIVQLRGISQAYAQGEVTDLRDALGLQSERLGNGWRNGTKDAETPPLLASVEQAKT